MAVTLERKAGIDVRPIRAADISAVAEFLHANLNGRVPAVDWARAVDVPWQADRPNAGFMLLEGDALVGVHLAFYSERIIEGRPERFCNLGAWCVLPDYRFHSLRLLRALLSQPGYHFTDLSPSGPVVGLNVKLGFQFLDTTTTLVPNLPWPSIPRHGTITSDPRILERALDGAELKCYRDHATARAAHHLLLTHGAKRCYVMFRKDRRKGLPLFATILYVSNPGVFRAMTRRLGRYLLLRHSAVATLIEAAVVDHHPALSRTVDTGRRKMFRSSSLAPAQIDYLYSELVCLSW